MDACTVSRSRLRAVTGTALGLFLSAAIAACGGGKESGSAASGAATTAGTGAATSTGASTGQAPTSTAASTGPALTAVVKSEPSAGDVAMVPVPAGKSIGQDLPAFEIDKTEVTVASYWKCVEAGACTAPGATTWCNTQKKPDHPVNCVDYDQAETYCRWAGKRLPTEAEWKLAAFGPTPRLHPWGGGEPSIGPESDKFICGLNQSANPGETCVAGARPSGASPVGALDMAGNVSEWLIKGASPEYYTMGSCNCSPSGGAAWTDVVEKKNVAGRKAKDSLVGIRCVRGGKGP